MGKSVADSVIDAALESIATCTRIDVTSDTTTPTNLTNTLATTTLTAGDGAGDYVIADGTTGRKVTVAQQENISITATGTAKHVVLSVGGVIKLTTTCTDQVLTAGGTVTIPAFSDTIADPT